MAGARIEFSLETSHAEAALDFVAGKLDNDGVHLLLTDIGEYLLGSTRDRAAREVSPDGTPWPALSPRYARRKEKKRPGAKMLTFDHHMLGDRLASQVEGDTLYVGTSAKYGAIQQFGGTIQHHAYSRIRDRATIGAHEVTIPARPWLGIDQQDEEEIVALTRDHLLMGLEGGTP